MTATDTTSRMPSRFRSPRSGRRRIAYACACACVLSLNLGCTERIRLDHDPLDTLVELRITPAQANIEITDLSPPHHTLQYRAVGVFGDGSTSDVTDVVTWAIDRDILGGFDTRGLFIASHAAAGHATVAARLAGYQATADLQISIDVTLVDGTFPPPGAGLFDGKPVITGDTTRSPSLVYPADGTYLPRIIASTLFQLQPGTGNDAFRISFDNDVLHVSVETGADRWRADGDIQSLLAQSAGIDPLRVSIEATSTIASSVYAGPPVALGFSGDLGDSPLLYWSAATNGIMLGGVHLPSASKVYPSNGTCVGCHALSRDGRTMALAVDPGTATSFQLEALDVMSAQPLIPASPSRLMGWATWSGDNTRLVVANDGVLTLYNGVTGNSLGVVPLPAGHYATHPDWSPDSKTLAIAYTSQSPTNMDVRSASIALLTYTNGTWSAPQIVVDGSPTSNNYFPRWSPDGNLLAYVHATAPSRGATSAELMLVPTAGGTPIALTKANHQVGGAELPDLSNTMPAWAPRVGQRLFLAFTTVRPYGKVVTSGPGQIWITSLDLTATGDPSTPAFWVPCQDVTVLNNNPVWAGQQFTTL